MDGEHTLKRCAEVTEEVLRTVFNQLYTQRVMLEGMILKLNMVLPGLICPRQESVDEVAEALVISHKATTRIMLCFQLRIDVGRYRDRISMPVASLSVVEMTEQRPLLKALGDRAHLRESLRLRLGT